MSGQDQALNYTFIHDISSGSLSEVFVSFKVYMKFQFLLKPLRWEEDKELGTEGQRSSQSQSAVRRAGGRGSQH